jgi:hypothetical protein
VPSAQVESLLIVAGLPGLITPVWLFLPTASVRDTKTLEPRTVIVAVPPSGTGISVALLGSRVNCSCCSMIDSFRVRLD